MIASAIQSLRRNLQFKLNVRPYCSMEGLTQEYLRGKTHHELVQICLRLQDGKTAEYSAASRKQRPFQFAQHNQRKVAFKVAYFGERYHGLAFQDDIPETVEGYIFRALERACLIESREACEFSRCGRTDKGVSALGQVISLYVRTNLEDCPHMKPRTEPLPPKKAKQKQDKALTEIPYVQILNRILPEDIRVLGWSPAPADFSARFSCKGRMYRYFFFRHNHDLELMRRAAAMFHGEHDFRNFCKPDIKGGVTNFRRRVHKTSVEVSTHDGADQSVNCHPAYQLCEITIYGTAFLWHQIRCMVAVLFMVGQGKEEPEIVEQLLDIAKQPCKPQYEMASEIPLVLWDCEFEGLDWQIDQHTADALHRHLYTLWQKHAMRMGLVMGMTQPLRQLAIQGADKTWLETNDNNPVQMETAPHVQLLKRPTGDSIEQRIAARTKALAAKRQASERSESQESAGKKPHKSTAH
eukprot:TRINITY_DN11300_c0_g1_i3.p1 TRINITY_DN11300_c0_g1~~TRINITY_DN11300_c0_g1_i3.p1  ORF type:complete len:467 (+),score=46.82 TRINITY_DN11300_c0_g1_i3:1324-2724(+)